MKSLPRNPSFLDVGLWTIYQVQHNTPYKKKLLTKPKDTFQELGVELPGNPKIRILEDTSFKKNFVIPSNIGTDEPLLEHELEQVAAGKDIMSKESHLGGKTQSQGENILGGPDVPPPDENMMNLGGIY